MQPFASWFFLRSAGRLHAELKAGNAARMRTQKGNRPRERTVPCGIRDLLVNERQHRVDGGVVHAEAAHARADGVVVRLELHADDELAVAAEVCGQIDGRAEGGGQRGGRAGIAQRVQIRIDGERFAVDRNLPKIDMGDYLVIHDTGAHGFSMGYNYNGRLRSAELLLKEDGSVKMIRRAETPEDYFATFDCFDDLKITR